MLSFCLFFLNYCSVLQDWTPSDALSTYYDAISLRMIQYKVP